MATQKTLRPLQTDVRHHRHRLPDRQDPVASLIISRDLSAMSYRSWEYARTPRRIAQQQFGDHAIHAGT